MLYNAPVLASGLKNNVSSLREEMIQTHSSLVTNSPSFFLQSNPIRIENFTGWNLHRRHVIHIIVRYVLMHSANTK